MARIWWMNYRKRRQNKARIYVRLIPSRECLCSEFSLAQQKRTKEGLGPVLAGQRGSAHRTDMKLSGFIRQDRGTQGDDGNSTRPLPRLTPQAVRSKNMQVEKTYKAALSSKGMKFRVTSSFFIDSLNVCVRAPT